MLVAGVHKTTQSNHEKELFSVETLSATDNK